jgi:hypothetical protein
MLELRLAPLEAEGLALRRLREGGMRPGLA